MALQVGSRLGHYDVTALIGEGGIEQVYRAMTRGSISTKDSFRQGRLAGEPCCR